MNKVISVFLLLVVAFLAATNTKIETLLPFWPFYHAHNVDIYIWAMIVVFALLVAFKGKPVNMDVEQVKARNAVYTSKAVQSDESIAEAMEIARRNKLKPYAKEVRVWPTWRALLAPFKGFMGIILVAMILVGYMQDYLEIWVVAFVLYLIFLIPAVIPRKKLIEVRPVLIED